MFEKYRDNRDSGETTNDSRPEPAAKTSEPPRAPVSNARTTATIGATINIRGDVSGDENLIIDGKVDGSVNLASHELTVGQAGKVTADLSAKSIRIDGEVQGDITGKEKVIIAKSGNVRGNIVAPRVTLEDGAKFKGSIDMDPSVAEASTPKDISADKPASQRAQPQGVPASAVNEKKAQ